MACVTLDRPLVPQPVNAELGPCSPKLWRSLPSATSARGQTQHPAPQAHEVQGQIRRAVGAWTYVCLQVPQMTLPGVQRKSQMMVFRAQGRLQVSKGPLLGHKGQGWLLQWIGL